ncbi:uncharacterized protein N7500_008334 [Penicillium coprophilum]|uniref:uncharacterized protein n=1 Tax=Penicillium coprophilum TaxID=36646 RepID=UPI00239DE090|nr:uncharacterized protein N7500_008334 [Penicillium coprophilum]KAJ5158683.1 hypothetical protein N7500_008334 [Penicillium coprophilum]
MNPYIADPDHIPPADLYADLPLHGRYSAKPDDFCIDVKDINCQYPHSVQYWASVHDLCNKSLGVYPADEGGRDVSALGNIIVKPGYLHTQDGAEYSEIIFYYADANDVQAMALAKNVLTHVKPIRLTFDRYVSKRGFERLSGGALTVAWPSLSQSQKESFIQQSREILRQLQSIKPTNRYQIRSHIVPDPGTYQRPYPTP